MTITNAEAAGSTKALTSDGLEATPGYKKLVKAAQQFEGILLAQLLGDFETAISEMAGDAPLAGSDTLNSLAVQTLSGALARNGVLGIAQMAVRQLAPSLQRGENAESRRQ